MTEQSAAASPPRPSPSADAPPSLTFDWEHFSLVSRELLPLIRQYWEEVSPIKDTVPLDPDWERLSEMALLGRLFSLIVRSNGVVVGFALSVAVSGIFNASTAFAFTEAYWLHPAYREGWNGMRFLRANRDGLVERGAQVLCISDPLGLYDKAFKRLGYIPSETAYRLVTT